MCPANQWSREPDKPSSIHTYAPPPLLLIRRINSKRRKGKKSIASTKNGDPNRRKRRLSLASPARKFLRTIEVSFLLLPLAAIRGLSGCCTCCLDWMKTGRNRSLVPLPVALRFGSGCLRYSPGIKNCR